MALILIFFCLTQPPVGVASTVLLCYDSASCWYGWYDVAALSLSLILGILLLRHFSVGGPQGSPIYLTLGLFVDQCQKA